MILYTVTGKAGNEGFLDIAKSGELSALQLCFLPASDQRTDGGQQSLAEGRRA